MPFPALAAIGAFAANNAMSELHAGRQAEREREMMASQNAMNNANILGSYAAKVQGMKMAGLNPALAASGATPAVGAVSKGSAAAAENVEIDPASVLLQAQADNLAAQTDKVKAETEKLKGVDTQNTIADTLLKNASASEREATTRRVNQLNDQYSDQNKSLEGYGKVMAEKWQATDWYNRLAPETKNTIDAIASGEVPLTVGGLDALNRTISAQKDLSDADAAVVRNAFANSIIDQQLSDPDVVEALVKDVQAKYNLTKEQASNLKANTDKTLYKMKELIDLELQGKKYSNQLTREEAGLKSILKKAEKTGNMDYLRKEGDYGNYAWKVLENSMSRLFDLATMLLAGKYVGKAAGQAAGEAAKEEPRVKAPSDKDIENYGNSNPFRAFGSDPSRTIYTPSDGVQQMKYQRTQHRMDR